MENINKNKLDIYTNNQDNIIENNLIIYLNIGLWILQESEMAVLSALLRS
jgi:hypothetical protein